nr:hypothetical protein [Tanacetum cinerariifolium]
MATTIEQQVALDEALVPSTKRIPGQSFDALPFEEEILEFLRFLGHSAQIKTLTDVNINKLFRPCRSFGAVINKCLTRKSSGFNNFRLSQAQILWGLYHSKNIDYAFLIWEDFMYQVEHKNQKKRNEMDDILFLTIKVVSRHQNTQQYGAVLLIELTNEEIRNTKAYKEYYACATEEAAPKPKAIARRKRCGLDTSITPPTAIATLTTTGAVTPRLTAAAKGKQPTKAKSPSDPLELARTEAQQLKIVLRRSRQEAHISQHGGSGTDKGTGFKPGVPDRGGDDDEESKNDEESDDEETKEKESFDSIPRTPKDSEDDGNDEEDQGFKDGEDEWLNEEEEADELYRDVDIKQGRGLQLSQDIEDSHMTLTPVQPDGHQESSSVSSQFVTSMLNPTSDVGVESIFATASSSVAPLPTPTPTMTPSIITTITTASHPPIPPTPIPSAEDQPIVQSSQHPEWFSQPKKPPLPDHDWNKTLPAAQGSTQSWISDLAKQADSRSSFNELLDTPLDFSNFIMNRLRVDTLTPELLAGPTYDLIKGSCNSLTELEYHLEEVYKETTDQLDWVNPKGQQYPHNLLQPLPLIPDNRGRRVIPFLHFINNDLEYLLGGASSRKYTTSVTKTKAADYEHIKWIEDLVPRTMWIHKPINYDKHALWEVSHWGRKRQQFYGFAVNRESALDVYSKRRIIDVTDLKIVEWHNYRNLDWISVRRDDDKIYNFKEGDFKRLRLQEIEDTLLLLVQGKLSNLTVEERFAFKVSFRMFTRSIVIQRRVEDLQLGVKSYQKRLNLMKPDTYRSDLKRQEAYTAYSNPRGFIYQNKDKKNRLMQIDELYKFSDGTLNDVRNALDDRLKGIRMQYLPQTI